MRGLVQLSIVILLIFLPTRLSGASPRRLAQTLLVGLCVYWFVLLFVADRLPG